ncbi:hypothetical protein [Kitasatospora acidiphila]|uniref:hypothetical protein n=1 Tax=Kitasatospora acidiphila TaxID=2567942 RepID=UPI003C771B0C
MDRTQQHTHVPTAAQFLEQAIADATEADQHLRRAGQQVNPYNTMDLVAFAAAQAQHAAALAQIAIATATLSGGAE